MKSTKLDLEYRIEIFVDDPSEKIENLPIFFMKFHMTISLDDSFWTSEFFLYREKLQLKFTEFRRNESRKIFCDFDNILI
jgi:hypothetical protein